MHAFLKDTAYPGADRKENKIFRNENFRHQKFTQIESKTSDFIDKPQDP